MNRRALQPLTLAGVLAFALSLAACGEAGTSTSEATDTGGDSSDTAGEERIDFTLPNLEGTPQTLSQWDGDLIVLNFWATWCPPCKEEMPLFQDAFEAHRDDGFTIVAVAIDEQTATQHFIDDFGIEFPVLIGQDEAMEVGNQYGNRIGALPYTVLIDRDGTIVDTHRGEVEPEHLEAWLNTYL